MQDFKFKIDGKDYTANVVEEESGKLSVTVNGKSYEVEVPGHVASHHAAVHHIKPAAPVAAAAAPAAAAPAAAPRPSAGANVVSAPLPGTITAINVKVGDAVKAGQVVLVMEAMKMSNDITAESDGTVKNILVQQGAQVQSGDALIELG